MLRNPFQSTKLTPKHPYLFKRDNSQHWQLRLMVPKAARPILCRAEFTKGLGVANKALTIDLSYAILADWKAAINVALVPSGPTYASTMDADALADIAVEVGYHRATSRVVNLVERKAKEGAAAFADLKAKFDQRANESVRHRWAGDHSYWAERARKLIADRNLAIADNEPEFATLSGSSSRTDGSGNDP